MLGNLSAEQVEHLLYTEVVGRIGCHAGGRTYVVPVTYAYDGGCIYAHSAEGRKIEMMRANPEVCFEVDHVDGLSRWQSVIAAGRYEELEGTEAGRGMQILVDRLMPLMVSSSAMPHADAGEPPGGRPPVLFRIHLGERSGRFEGP